MVDSYTTPMIGNVIPIAIRAGASQVAVSTTASQTTTPYGFSTSTQADAIVSMLNEVRATLVAAGYWKGAA